MKRLTVLLLSLLAPSLHATTYYVSNAGSDSQSGTSSSAPWASIAKLNAAIQHAKPGDSFLLQRGSIFRDDYIRCANTVNATDATTLATNAPACSGNASAPVVIGAYGSGAAPLIDAADPLTGLSWKLVRGTTYVAHLATVPGKVYVDSQRAETTPLLPVPNAMGTYNPGKVYPYLSLLTAAPDVYVCGNMEGCTGQAPGTRNYWWDLYNSAAGNSSQSFNTENTGVENVESKCGSFWYDTANQLLYVNLEDGSNPSSHVLEGTHRKYGVFLQSTNYVTVENIAVERPFYDAFAAITYSDTSRAGHYYTNEYIHFVGDFAWNYGSIAEDTVTSQIYGPRVYVVGGYLFYPAVGNASHVQELMRGEVVQGSYAGTMDTYFGIRGSGTYQDGIVMANVASGQIVNNTASPVNATCMNYGPATNVLNSGGTMTGNVCTNAQGNFYFGGTIGGLVEGNIAHDSYGEGIQLGGSLPGMLAPEISYNLIYNIGVSASTVLYNGIDCNSAASFAPYVHNNTIVNTYAASITMEGSCDHMHAEANILDQSGVTRGMVNYSSASGGGNHSNLVYVSSSVAANPSFQWDHNLFRLGSNSAVATYKRLQCSTIPVDLDTTGRCENPMYVSQPEFNYHLTSGSPALNAPVSAGYIGALTKQ